MRRFLAALLGAVLLATFATAATVPVLATKLIVVDRVATAAKAKVVFVSKDPNIEALVSFPLLVDARLDVAYDGAQGTWMMPAGAEWTVVPFPPGIAKYVNKDAPAGGAVRSSTIKHDLLLKVVGTTLGDDPIDISQPPIGPVYVAHTLHDGPETTRHCTQFTGCVHSVIAGGTGYKLVCREGTAADPACIAAPATTTTTLPPCPVPPAAVWTCCQAPSFASCSVEYRTTGDVSTYCTGFGGVATPGRCGAPACAAQGCCLDAVLPAAASCGDLGIDGSAGEVASAMADCLLLGGTWLAGPCP